MSYIMAAIVFSCGPLFLSIKLPMEAWYPFSTDAPHIRSIIYVMQVFAILQTGFCITVDFMIGMFFWYTTARLEMLALELQQTTHECQMKSCFRKHQEIIKYVHSSFQIFRVRSSDLKIFIRAEQKSFTSYFSM